MKDKNVYIWQPIATAPKDGTKILVYDGFDRYIVYWCKEQNYWESICPGFCSAELWMPLPDPPKEKS